MKQKTKDMTTQNFGQAASVMRFAEIIPISVRRGRFLTLLISLLIARQRNKGFGKSKLLSPNPKGIRTADFIFVRKGVLKLFDLKTITGKNSVGNRLSESVGQTNRVLLYMTADYNPGTLARSIKRYFELNPYAREILVYKGKKQISVTRKSLEDTNFFRTFIRRYAK